jgi:hypothetical protein
MPALNQIYRRYPYQNGANDPNTGGLPQYAPPPGTTPQGAAPSGVTLPPPNPTNPPPGYRYADPGIPAAGGDPATDPNWFNPSWFNSLNASQPFTPGVTPTSHTYAANDWRNPQTFAGYQAQSANMDPAQKYLFAMANRIPPANLGLSPGEINTAEQGLMGYTMNKNTGQITGVNGQPVDPSQMLSIMNTQLGGAPGADAGSFFQWRNGQAGTFDPSTFTPQDFGLPGTAAERRQQAIAAGGGARAQPQELGGMAGSGAGGAGNGAGVGTLDTNGINFATAGGNDPNNPYSVANYLDPSMGFQMNQGLRALGSSAAAGGQTFSGNTLKDILGYSQGLASTAYNSAADRAMADRSFGYGVQKDSQTIPFSQEMQLAGLGTQNNAINADLAKSLAGLISGNTIAGGQAAGAGTIGGNNAITQMLSSIFGNLQSNQTLQQILARAGGTPAASTTG